MLREWCSFELHTVVVDTGESPLEETMGSTNEPGSGKRQPYQSEFSTPQGPELRVETFPKPPPA
jgi:hypothetical protein